MQQVYGPERRVHGVFPMFLFFSLIFFFHLFFCHFFNQHKIQEETRFGLSLTSPLAYLKVKKKMDPIFEHPVFDSAKEKMKCFIRFFLLQNRSGLLTK